MIEIIKKNMENESLYRVYKIMKFMLIMVLISVSVSIFASDSKKDKETVYVVGVSRNSDGKNVPGYWKNGKWTSLPVIDPKQGAFTGNIILKGNDFYISGSCQNKNGKFVGGYWLNGKWFAVSKEDSLEKNLAVESLSVVQDGIFLFGESSPKGSIFPVQGYWKDGEWTSLPTKVPGEKTLATSLFVNGKDIYVTGIAELEPGSGKAGYWKNEKWVTLPTPDSLCESWTFGLYVDEDPKRKQSDIYVWGCITNDKGSLIPCYWKNGLWTSLLPLESKQGGNISSLLVYQGDVYMSGYIFNHLGKEQAGYWLNDQWVELSQPIQTESSDASSLIIVDGDIFATGSCYIHEVYIAGYWKNGVWNELPSIDSEKYSWGSSILVVREK